MTLAFAEDFAGHKYQLDRAFRRFGIEGEDAFYALAYYYYSHSEKITLEPTGGIVRKGEYLLNKVIADGYLAQLLDSIKTSDPRGDHLPAWYQHFLGRRFREGSGKFFTPQPVAAAMSKLLPYKDDAVIMDPTCGGGTFLLEASRLWRDSGCSLVANDVEPSLVELTQLVLGLGTPSTHGKHFLCTNIYEPDAPFREWYGRVDYIVANPPFSLKVNMLNVDSRLFSLGYTNSDALFLDISFELLRPGGRLVCLLPHSIVVNTEFQKMRRAVEELWDLLGVVVLPEGVFHLTANTTTRADIVILEKKGSGKSRASVVFASAPSVGIPLDGRTKRHQQNHLGEIVTDGKVSRTLGVDEPGS